MRLAGSLVALWVLAGCPASQSLTPGGGDWPDGGPTADAGPRPDSGQSRDGGAGSDGGADTCEQVARCAVSFTYTNASATAVSLRGDFAPDGWTRGVAMTRSGGIFTASVDAADGATILYKLVVD